MNSANTHANIYEKCNYEDIWEMQFQRLRNTGQRKGEIYFFKIKNYMS